MRHALKPHPDTPPDRITAVDVELAVDPGDDVLMTFIVGGSADLLIPDRAPAGRRDGLWETTCFEAFFKPVGGEPYFEFNFSPSTEWAAFRFARYRKQGMRPLERPVDPILRRIDGSRAILEVDLDLSGLPDLPMRMGLCAVIEERNGRKSYWALAHPPGKPDFHHQDCFALELPAATHI
jgi:hypothetical protein